MGVAATEEIPADVAAALMDQARELAELEDAAADPRHLLKWVRCVDNTTGDHFEFHFAEPFHRPYEIDPETRERTWLEFEPTGWEFQGELIAWWLGEDVKITLRVNPDGELEELELQGSTVTLVLKARQLGITWCAAGLALWFLLYKPGTRVLIQSKNEDDAADLVDHIWEMFLSLQRDHGHLLNGVRIITPANPAKHRPHLNIEAEHRDGRITQINAMASTSGAGHGRTAALVILDEFSRHPYARDAYKAVIPAQGGSSKTHGITVMISTGNGVSSDDGEGGNYFHYLYSNAAVHGIATVFLGWFVNPDRDRDWFNRVAMKLKAADRGEQYPSDDNEAFILTGDVYYDIEKLEWYRKHRRRDPIYRFDFIEEEGDPGERPRARKHRHQSGRIRVYLEPVKGHEYAIYADVASGRGKDFNAAYVIDLGTQELVAHLHGKYAVTDYTRDLHYLGKWFNTALLAPEMGGGWGEPVVIFLKDGKDSRPPYPKVYRHRIYDKVTKQIKDDYGFPINTHTRPLLIAALGKAIDEQTLPFIDGELMGELRTFVNAKTLPSPRAQEGTNDDRVLAACGCLELYRMFGRHPKREHRRGEKKHKKGKIRWTPTGPVLVEGDD